MRRVIPGRDGEAATAQLRSALRSGARVVVGGDAKTLVRRGRYGVAGRRCNRRPAVPLNQSAVTQEAPVLLAAAVLRWIDERTVATEVAAALQDRHGDPGGPPQP